MNRTKNFVGVIARVLQGFEAYQIEDLESLKAWTGILKDDLLLDAGPEHEGDVRLYLRGVHQMCSEAHDMRQALIMEVLVDKFKQTKRG